MGTLAYSYYPNGYGYYAPPATTTWTDQVPGRAGTVIAAHNIAHDAAPAILWHRQRALFVGLQTIAQSIPNTTWTAINSFEELIDNYAGHSDSTNPGRWYAPGTQSSQGSGDWYLCTGYIPFNSNSGSAAHIVGLRKNGSGTIYEGGKVTAGPTHAVTPIIVDLMQMNGITASDYLELMAYQTTGSSINTVVSGKAPTLTTRWVCANPAWASAAIPALPGVPHSWVASDLATADLTGTIGGRTCVPLNRELRDAIDFLNNPPIARLTSEGTSQTVPSGSGTWTSINMTGKTVDNYGGHSNSTNNTRYTCQRAGVYYVAGYVSVAESSSNSGYRACRLLVNGTTPYGGMTTVPMSLGSTGTGLYAIAQIRLAVGDYVELQMQQTEGSTLAVVAGANNCSRLIAVWRRR